MNLLTNILRRLFNFTLTLVEGINIIKISLDAVSYTHLTLPTILLV